MAALTIDEDWVRSRVNLQHESLEDVRSLSLPGTYNEKIGSLGAALRKFTRLVKLDLSRNAIESLSGLENLQGLESINLYYNNIHSLDELERLGRSNPFLKEVDLRLNPVSRTETDYRLLLIHLLPDLEKLDDRDVRTSEREAAALHFRPHGKSSPQITITPPPVPGSTSRSVPSRVTMTTMDEEDRQVLDILGKDKWGEKGKVKAVRDRGVENFSAQEVKQNETAELSFHSQKSDNHSELVSSTGQQQGDRSYEKHPPSIYKEEREAYSLYKGRGHFTANPDWPSPTGEGQGQVRSPHEGEPSADNPHNCPVHLIKLLDLVDKYWNGSKSLHKHNKFIKLFEEGMRSVFGGSGDQGMRDHGRRAAADSATQAALKKSEEKVSQLQIMLDKTSRESDELRRQVQNQNQRSRKASGEKMTALEGELREVRGENRELAIRLKQYSQMEELTRMLQESHKSLVQTNEHLLRELEESRERYQAEMTQLSTSYSQLKASVMRLPQSSNRNGM